MYRFHLSDDYSVTRVTDLALTETIYNVIICIYIFYLGGHYLLCFIVIYSCMHASSNILYRKIQ